MGKRSRRTPAVQQKAIWDHESQIALLGLLDFCIQHQHTFPFEQDFVVGRLYPSGLPHKPYSWKQVKRKLFSLWKNYGQNDSPNKEEILRKGSTCFAELALTEDEKTLIKSVSERLEEELKPVLLPFHFNPLGKYYSNSLLVHSTESARESRCQRRYPRKLIHDSGFRK